MSTETAAAMNGSVEALENASYIPQNIMVTGGAGTLLHNVMLLALFTVLFYIIMYYMSSVFHLFSKLFSKYKHS